MRRNAVDRARSIGGDEGTVCPDLGAVPAIGALQMRADYGIDQIRFGASGVVGNGAGQTIALVVIGVLVVQVPRFVEARGGDRKILRALPTVSAIAVIGVGLWLCYEWSQGR